MFHTITPIFSAFILLASSMFSTGRASEAFIVVQSTTSTQNSGFFDYVLPLYTERSGVEVRVVAVGTGQAIENARKCNGDVLIVHAQAEEEAFVAAGYGIRRYDLMYNDFVIVGPDRDPAGVRTSRDVLAAFRSIAETNALFLSRGDESGTHKKELALWRAAGLDPLSASGRWYRETGSGMGATLNMGIAIGAYVLTDRATWISFGNKGRFKVLFEGDDRLFNQYGIILVNSEQCPRVKADLGAHFVDWLVSEEGQAAVGAFSVDGQQLFFPNAQGKSPAPAR